MRGLRRQIGGEAKEKSERGVETEKKGQIFERSRTDKKILLNEC